MRRPLITLTTDFGLRDSYVAEMKAVILGICPGVAIVDITHQVEKFNVRMGAFVLASAALYFPEGAVHLAVVDPGVGTKRQPIIVWTRRTCFVGPDNGVLALAAKSVGGRVRIHRIANREFMLPRVSSTFHGRDIFAPVAAHLANGRSPDEFGPEVHRMMSAKSFATVRGEDVFVGQVVHVDDFGNIVTSFTGKELEKMKIKGEIHLEVGKARLTLPLLRTYGDIEKQQPLAVIGSHNFLEISVNQGNAARIFDVAVGNKVVICPS